MDKEFLIYFFFSKIKSIMWSLIITHRNRYNTKYITVPRLIIGLDNLSGKFFVPGKIKRFLIGQISFQIFFITWFCVSSFCTVFFSYIFLLFPRFIGTYSYILVKTLPFFHPRVSHCRVNSRKISKNFFRWK